MTKAVAQMQLDDHMGRTPPTVLILPGWQGSGPDHWQMRWAHTHGYAVVAQDVFVAAVVEQVAAVDQLTPSHRSHSLQTVSFQFKLAQADLVVEVGQRQRRLPPSAAARLKEALIAN